ncbi:S-adenosyl-L-methionine-dependent methyltransferase [Achaetomium macrosporum]|uniref:S-adenosyl-L-methionine-dependent methyltransferase n=1 Tax=Achaetomium macrosporum TaxID=79813 RepID=A0AAN7H889_9PEZI|nr:S-adenosyl-L-methionine-dependent methyltransferase [Achaetomium macrosporum]
MPTVTESVSKLYGRIAQLESRRLADHPMEREITLRAIRKGLGSASGKACKRIADIGGGPGRIAFALADEGHHVDLIDLTLELIQLAEAEQETRRAAGNKPLLRSIAVGNALDKSTLNEGSYDAVLLLGPLYHLLDESERATAVSRAQSREASGGLVFVAFITVEAHLRDIAMREPSKLVEFKDFYAKYLCDGRYEKSEPGQGKTVQSFHTRSGDIRAFFAKHFADSLDLVELRSTEGILGGGLDATLAKSSDEIVQAWADLLFDSYSVDAQHLGCADHLLATLRRK